MFTQNLKAIEKVPVARCISYGILLSTASQFLLWGQLISLTLVESIFIILLSSLLMALLTCSITEVTSFLPFFAGSYGLVRTSLSPFLGFFVGIFELSQITLFNSIILYGIAKIIVYGLNISHGAGHYVAIWIVTIVITLAIFTLDFKYIFKIKFFLGAFSFFLYFVIMIGLMTVVNDEIPPEQFEFRTSVSGLFSKLKDPYWFFYALTSLPILGLHTENPKKNISKINITSLVFFIIFSFLSVILMSLAYRKLRFGQLALVDGFNITLMNNSSSSALYLLLVCPLLFIFLTYFYVEARIVSSMSESRFFFGYFELDSEGSPKKATLLLIMLCIFIVALMGLGGGGSGQYAYLVLAAGTYLTNLIQLIACYVFNSKFSSLKREFKSPFRTWGVCLGIILSAFLSITTLIFNSESVSVVCVIVAIFIFTIIMYLYYVKKNQRFSDLEQKALFAAYIIKANQIKNKRRRLKKTIDKNSIPYKILNHIYLLGKILELITNPIREKFALSLPMDKMQLDQNFLLDDKSNNDKSNERSNSKPKSKNSNRASNHQENTENNEFDNTSEFESKSKSFMLANISSKESQINFDRELKPQEPKLSSLLLQFFCCIQPPDLPVSPTEKNEIAYSPERRYSRLNPECSLHTDPLSKISTINYIPPIKENDVEKQIYINKEDDEMDSIKKIIENDQNLYNFIKENFENLDENINNINASSDNENNIQSNNADSNSSTPNRSFKSIKSIISKKSIISVKNSFINSTGNDPVAQSIGNIIKQEQIESQNISTKESNIDSSANEKILSDTNNEELINPIQENDSSKHQIPSEMDSTTFSSPEEPSSGAVAQPIEENLEEVKLGFSFKINENILTGEKSIRSSFVNNNNPNCEDPFDNDESNIELNEDLLYVVEEEEQKINNEASEKSEASDPSDPSIDQLELSR